MSTYDDLPKVELHLHLDCSLSYDVVRELAPDISEDQYRRDFIAPAKCRNLADYLTRAVNGFSLMQDEHALRLVTRDLFAQLERDNVIYAEIRFAPLLHTAGGLSPERVVGYVADEADRASGETGVEARLILCTLRHYSADQSMETVRLVDSFRGTRVAAFDIAGDEAGFPLEPHVPAFLFAHEHGLNFTAHAGEAAGPESIWETLQELASRRLGHGVRSVEDPELIRYLREERIHLEVNPSSNVQTNICEVLADHPLPRLADAGLSLGINTDCRTITDVTLSEEYRRVAETFGWDEREFLRSNLDALEAAFVPEQQKALLRERILAAWATPAA